MATANNTGGGSPSSAFIAALLAPLPKGEELDGALFLQEVKREERASKPAKGNALAGLTLPVLLSLAKVRRAKLDLLTAEEILQARRNRESGERLSETERDAALRYRFELIGKLNAVIAAAVRSPANDLREHAEKRQVAGHRKDLAHSHKGWAAALDKEEARLIAEKDARAAAKKGARA